MWLEYTLFVTDESFDYQGPFGTETFNQMGAHGFEVKVDDKWNIIDWCGVGEFGYETAKTKGNIRAFYDLVKSTHEDYPDKGLDGLLELIELTIEDTAA